VDNIKMDLRDRMRWYVLDLCDRIGTTGEIEIKYVAVSYLFCLYQNVELYGFVVIHGTE
jgi:hypothetical protein